MLSNDCKVRQLKSDNRGERGRMHEEITMSEPTEMQEGNVAVESDQIRKKLLSGETLRTSAASSSSSTASFYNTFDEPYDGLSSLETTENDADVNTTFLRLLDCQPRGGQRISEGNFDLLNALLEQGANINCVDEYGQTPLHKVARRQQLDVAKFLIEKGADVNLGDKFGRTALHIAAIVDCPCLVELLIDSGVDTEVQTEGEQQTAVHYAARYGCIITLATLQHRGADLSARDFKRRTPLFLAAAQGNPGSLNSLLELIVIHKLFDVASHPAVRKLVDIKWKAYGLAGACVRLFLELFFIITWSVLMMGVDWENRHVYTFPQSVWRAVLATVCLGQLAINVVAELGEFRSASRALRCWREWWRSELSQNLRFCHPCWPQEKIYLEQELKKINKVKAKYFVGFWSFLHWLVLVLLLSLVGLHVAFILKPSWNDARRYDHLVAITIIPLWLHNMKHLRPFKIVGPLIIILGKMAVYILKAFFLFGQFFLAFFFSFWLIFGNKDIASVQDCSGDPLHHVPHQRRGHGRVRGHAQARLHDALHPGRLLPEHHQHLRPQRHSNRHAQPGLQARVPEPCGQ
ncbi:transient receptor potential channel pyrexia-like isoform X3 [Lethenteron reissneri]|uniref:transient receptor potential channel pyrexia-like isoform X3 n=1 Tax=Lethenteron reissneri TaxID=7753 RepID=UPI002AB764AA|nr:transient receptor potential channel pyrexia-like isoform X3 [Lethenteron reissneri]